MTLDEFIDSHKFGLPRDHTKKVLTVDDVREFMKGKVLVDKAEFDRIAAMAANWEDEEFGNLLIEAKP